MLPCPGFEINKFMRDFTLRQPAVPNLSLESQMFWLQQQYAVFDEQYVAANSYTRGVFWI